MNLVIRSTDRCNKDAMVSSLTVTTFLLIVNVSKGTIACLLQWSVTLKIEFIITGTVSWWAMIVASSDVSGETVDEGVDSSGVVVLGCVSVFVWHEAVVSSIVVTMHRHHVFLYVGDRKVGDDDDGFPCLSPWWWWWLRCCGVGDVVARLSCCTRERCCWWTLLVFECVLAVWRY